MTERYLIDYDNPDAGIGHSMGFINRAIKIASRNQLSFAYSESLATTRGSGKQNNCLGPYAEVGATRPTTLVMI